MCRIIALIILSSLCYNCHNIAPMLKKRNQQDKVTSKDLDQQLMKKEQNSHSHKWNSKSNSFFLQDIEKTALPKSHYSRRKLLETTGNFKKIRHDLILPKSNYSTRNGSSDPILNFNAAKLSRYIVHNSKWAAVGTNSRLDHWKQKPYVNIKQISDGTKTRSTGIPYFYLNRFEETHLDLENDNRICLGISREFNFYCTKNNLMVEDASCGGVLLIGHMEEVKNGTEEFDFAEQALFGAKSHKQNLLEDYYIAKIVPFDVVLIDKDAYPKCVPLDVYYNIEL